MNAPTDRWEPYRVITDDIALLEACIDRAEDLNISRITIDEAGGFTPGYSAKLLCNPPMKTMVNSSLGKMLKALGLALVVVVDDERFAGTKTQLSKRKKRMRPVARIRRVKGFFTKENAREMSKRQFAASTKKSVVYQPSLPAIYAHLPRINEPVPAIVRQRRKAAKARWKAERRRAKRKAQPRAGGASLIPPNAASCGHDQAAATS